jgi:Mg2+ and Co2+ transporter CorA
MRMLELKKDMLDKNMEIRKENGVIRQDFRQVRQDLKVKYKEKFVKALGTKLDKFSTERLNKVLEKIEIAIEKTNANEKLSQTNKDKILAQLDALKAIINEKL